jgi:hypothetical protein
MTEDELAGLPDMVAAIEGLTASLVSLRVIRAEYEHVHGYRKSQADFAELDKALRVLRRAARF